MRLLARRDAPVARADDPRLTAFHEAGHVVMALLNKRVPRAASIASRDREGARLLGCVEGFTFAGLGDLEPAIDFLLAGPAAERCAAERLGFAHPGRLDPYHDHDYRLIEPLVRLAYESRESPALELAKRIRAVERSFRSPEVWEATSFVARRLLRERTLRGEAMLDACFRGARRLHGRNAVRDIARWLGYRQLVHEAYGGRVTAELDAAARSSGIVHWPVVIAILLFMLWSWLVLHVA